MFCIHCKYTSFDYLPACPRCGRDWTREKKALNLDWLVASAPESKHQRQIADSTSQSPSQSYAFASQGRQNISRDQSQERDLSPDPHPNAAPSPATSQALDQGSQPEITQPCQAPSVLEEDDLDFPDLDDMLASQTSTSSSKPSQEAHSAEDDEFLDLGTLVTDLGLEDDTENEHGSPSSASNRPEEKKSPSSS
ncbi:MAG: hypothetical protein R6V55_00630 [Desulfovermiculus sp.]